MNIDDTSRDEKPGHQPVFRVDFRPPPDRPTGGATVFLRPSTSDDPHTDTAGETR